MTRPAEPRPALRKAPDGSMHPAAPRPAEDKHLHAAPPSAVGAAGQYRPGDLRARKAASESPKPKKSELVTVEVRLPKKLRKAARKKAEAEGWTFDQAVRYVLRAWVDG